MVYLKCSEERIRYVIRIADHPVELYMRIVSSSVMYIDMSVIRNILRIVREEHNLDIIELHKESRDNDVRGNLVRVLDSLYPDDV